jgi:GNAT superfamily N-acetyltransferase
VITLVPARPADLPSILGFRREASEWLRQRGIDQWSNPFPPEGILATIEAGETWMAWDGTVPAATITVAREGEPELWDQFERAEPAIYCHKLTVARAYAGMGIGAELLDWAGGIAHDEDRRWLRLDAWDTNSALHDYYRRQGFWYIRAADRPPSGALFQRVASPYAPRLLQVETGEPTRPRYRSTDGSFIPR